MRYFERVVVGLAQAPVDIDVVRYARLIHSLGQGEPHITFVHVLPPADVAALHGTSVQSLTEARAALQATVAAEFGPDGYSVEVLSGSHVDVLLKLAAERAADLVLVGHRRSARGRRSLCRRLATKAPCSVWMVPEGSPPRITGVVGAIDFSLSSAYAISMATLIASRAGLERCTALHVEVPSQLGFDEVDRLSAERAVERFLAPLELHDVTVTRHIEESGSVAGVIAALVQRGGHDLVVVGTRGRSPSAAILLGSESEHVLVESPVPVLVTKETGERIGVLRALFDRDLRPRYEPHFG